MNARVVDRTLVYGGAILLAIWVLIPLYLIAISAFTPQPRLFDYPKPLVPTTFSTDTMQFFLEARGVIPSVINSILVALFTIAFGLALGTPAGYALARIAILSIPLAVTFLQLGLYDNLIAVALVHTAMALPFVILVTGGVFVAVSHELEEAAQTLGCSRWGAFLRVALPLALPGLAAAAIFTFVISWNEVFAATILTLRTRTLPAHVLAALGTSPLGFKFAGGLFMAMPAVVFIFLIRRYLMNLWSSR